jgi:energy-coupling factor transporter ATP-binding protein EcfA2
LDAKGRAGLVRLIENLKAQDRLVLVADNCGFWPPFLFEKTLELKKPLGHYYPPKEERSLTALSPESPDISALPRCSPGEPAAKEGRAILEIADLSVRLAGHQILDKAQVSMEAGQIVSLVGDNGAGKTTLLKIICGLIRPQKGHIFIRGHKASPRKRLAHCAAVLQDPDFQLFSATVKGELALGLRQASIFPEQWELIKAFQLDSLLDRHPGSLSKGEKQRVLLAAAFSQKRDIYLFDEPTAGLGREMAAEFIRRIRLKAQAGSLVIIISHDRELVKAAAHKVYLVENQSIIKSAMFEEDLP